MSHAVNRLVREKLGRDPLGRHHAIHPRSLDLGDPKPPREGNPIVVVSGVRRCGKTHRLFQEMERLLALGVPRERICYFDFEDERLEAVAPATGDLVLRTFRAMHPVAESEGAFLFLDGIHAMAGWRSWARRTARNSKLTIYATCIPSMASPDTPLQDVKHSEGFVEHRLFPYSFAEYQRFAPVKNDVVPLDDEMRFAHHTPLSTYLTGGGFPEAVDLDDDRRTKLLQERMAHLVLGDVVERCDLATPRFARRLAHRMIAANGQPLTFRSAARELRDAGIHVPGDRLSAVFNAILAADLVFRIPGFDLEVGEVARNPLKLYAVDPGMARACARVHANNISFLLEDAVYLELLRRTGDDPARRVRCLKLRESGHEIDFVTGDPLSGNPSALYQVTWSIASAKVREREVRSILETYGELARLRGSGGSDLPEATIIIGDCTPQDLAETRSYLGDIGGPARRIALVSASEWLLGSYGAVRGGIPGAVPEREGAIRSVPDGRAQ